MGKFHKKTPKKTLYGVEYLVIMLACPWTTSIYSFWFTQIHSFHHYSSLPNFSQKCEKTNGKKGLAAVPWGWRCGAPLWRHWAALEGRISLSSTPLLLLSAPLVPSGADTIPVGTHTHYGSYKSLKVKEMDSMISHFGQIQRPLTVQTLS